MKILIVDDERDIEILFNMKFRREIKNGIYNFHFSFSAEAALDYLQKCQNGDVVLILSDINMPGMNGLELLRIIKQNYPYLKVFMITAYDDAEKHKLADEYGADDYLTKPLDFKKLKNTIDKFKDK